MVSRKLGLHILGDGFDPARLGRPTVVKLVDPSVGYKQRVRAQVGPDCLIVIRFYEAQQPLDAPRVRAREWWERNSGQIMGLNDPNVVYEGYNEIADDNALANAIFEYERMGFLHNGGFHACVVDSSAGTPDLLVWSTAFKAMLDAMRASDVVGLHEYWPDAPGLADTWLCGRWRLVPELAEKRIVITECGRDRVKVSKVWRGQPGWKLTTDAETYLRELGRYEALMVESPNVIGGCVYQAAAVDPRWAAFDVAEIWDRVVAQYAPEGGAMPKITLGPFLQDHRGWVVTRQFGYADPCYADGFHKGTDFARPGTTGTEGAVVISPVKGRVDFVSQRADRGWEIYIYSDGFEFCIYHLMQEPRFKPEDPVELGQFIGHVGGTGVLSTGPHAHVGLVWTGSRPPYPIDTSKGRQGWVDIISSDVIRLWEHQGT